MKTELENANWIVEGIRESLEMIKQANEESSMNEWDKVAEAAEAGE